MSVLNKRLPKLQVSVEETKVAEITKRQRIIDALNVELKEAKSHTIKQGNKNVQRQSDLELSMKEKYELQKQLQNMEDFKKENAILKVSFFTAYVWCIKIDKEYFISFGRCKLEHFRGLE